MNEQIIIQENDNQPSLVIETDVSETTVIINTVIDNPAPAAEISGVPLETAATKSAISGSTVKRFIEVQADEDNGNGYSMYFFNGVSLVQLFLA